MPVLKRQNGTELVIMKHRIRLMLMGRKQERREEGSATSSSLDPLFLKRTGERGCTLLPGAVCSGLDTA